MGIQDLIIGPLFFLIILFFTIRFSKKIPDENLRKHFVRGMVLKLGGALFVALIYHYYYGTGDSIFYFRRGVYVLSRLHENFGTGFKLIFGSYDPNDYTTNSIFESLRAFDSASYIVVRIVAMIGYFSFSSYLGIAFIFTALSYAGIWRLTKVFIELFPNFQKEVVYSFLYIPSVVFWGSGILKDCLALGFLGVLVSSGYYLFLKRKGLFLNSLLLIVSIYVVGTVKSYILMALMPAIGAWVFIVYRSKIRSKILKTLSTPFVLLLSAVLGVFMLNQLSIVFQKFSIDNFQDRAEDMQRWHTYRVQVLKGGEGSHYSLGEVDFSTAGLFKKAPAAINVALFRPYFWESRNPIVLLAASESFILLYLTLLFIRELITNFRKVVGFIEENPTIIFMIIFSLILAFAVGFTSYNFGALSRYRIPLLPFYAAAMLILRKNSKKIVQ